MMYNYNKALKAKKRNSSNINTSSSNKKKKKRKLGVDLHDQNDIINLVDEDDGHTESVEIKNSTFKNKKVTNGNHDKGKNNESPTIISLLENDTMINNNYNNNDDDDNNNMNVTSNMSVNDNNENKTVISQSDSSNEEKDNSILPPPTPIYELYDGYDFPKHSPYGFCGALTKYLRKNYGVSNFSSFIAGIKSILEEYNYKKNKQINKKIKKETYALKTMENSLLIQLIKLLKDTYVNDDENYMKIILKFNTLFDMSKKEIYDVVNYVENILLGIKKSRLMQKKKKSGIDMLRNAFIGNHEKESTNSSTMMMMMDIDTEDDKQKSNNIEVIVDETINVLIKIIICNNSIEIFLQCMVKVFTTNIVIPARIPIEVTFGKRIGKKGYLLTEGKQKGGMYNVEIEEKVVHRQKKKKKKKGSSSNEENNVLEYTKTKLTRERPYNFRLIDTGRLGLGFRDSDFKMPAWKTVFDAHANDNGDDIFDEHWNSCIVHCTACGEMLKSKSHVLLHPRLNIIICHKCTHVYKRGNFNINPETGSEQFCRWCGDGGSVMGCDHCTRVFCQTCIHRNFGPKEVERINDVEDWSCFLCDDTKIKPLQKSAKLTMKYLNISKDSIKKNELNIYDEFPVEHYYPKISKRLLAQQIVVEDVSNGTESMPIHAINPYKKKDLPPPFSYVTKSVVGEENLHLSTICRPDQIINCCSCEDDCRDPEKCECAKANDGSFAYNRRRELLRQRDVIYECNYRCKCHQNRCKNRVVGRGMTVPLEVFKTKQCGWGVKTLVDIPAGTFVCEYMGELISEQEAERRADPRLGDEYLLSLDTAWVLMKNEQAKEKKDQADGKKNKNSNGSSSSSSFSPSSASITTTSTTTTTTTTTAAVTPTFRAVSGAGSRLWRRVFNKQKGPDNNGLSTNYDIKVDEVDANDDQDMICIDAKWYGNVARFINHSCEPNLEKQSVYVDSHDFRLPRLAFFASSSIKKGEELTWDYGYTKGQVKGKTHPCFCGAKKCRHVMY